MSEEFARQWLAAVTSVSLQFTVFVAIVATALFFLRSLPPRVRHVVWLLVLLRLAVPAGLTSPWGALPSSVARPPSAAVPAVADEGSANRLPTSESPAASGSDTVVADSTTPSGTTGSTTRSDTWMSSARVLFTMWSVGVLGLATVQVVRSSRQRRRMAAAMESLPTDVGRRIDQLRVQLGIRRPVDVRVVRGDAISGPAVQGCLRPRILLPSSLIESWRREELDPVVLHELIHIQRLDPVVRALANLLQIAWFFHPLAWWVGRRLGEEREKACDDAVVRRLHGEKRTYVRGLLRLVEEHAALAWDAPGLRMAAARRPLARRLTRMLQSHYDPQPAVGFLALAALVISVGLGMALSTEADMGAQGEAQDAPRIQARGVWRGAFFAESVEQVEDANRVYVGGDFTIGRPSTAMKPDAKALAARDPALFERLAVLGRLSATIIVDRDGLVRRVRFAGDIDEDLQRPFREVLDAARFDPTTHYERGPVLVEVHVDYFINPPDPRRSLYEPGQALVGDEAAEVDGRGNRGAQAIRRGSREGRAACPGRGRRGAHPVLLPLGGCGRKRRVVRAVSGLAHRSERRSPVHPGSRTTDAVPADLPFRTDRRRPVGDESTAPRDRPAGVSAGRGGRHPGRRRGGAGTPPRRYLSTGRGPETGSAASAPSTRAHGPLSHGAPQPGSVHPGRTEPDDHRVDQRRALGEGRVLRV